jgi:8-oxo-dGTP diphosphatase
MGSGIVIENTKGKILLHLRDNNPSIPFPNTWQLLGGAREPNETPEETIRREIKEEIEINLKDIKLLKIYNYPEITEHIFHVIMDLDLEKVKLNEGQKIEFFSKEQAKKLNFGFHDKEYVEDFFDS